MLEGVFCCEFFLFEMLGVLCLPPGPWAGSHGCVCTHSVREFIQTNIHTKGDVVSQPERPGREGVVLVWRELRAPYCKYFKSKPSFLILCLLQGESVFFVMTNLIVTPNQRQSTCPEVGRTEPFDPQTPSKPGVRADRGLLEQQRKEG